MYKIFNYTLYILMFSNFFDNDNDVIKEVIIKINDEKHHLLSEEEEVISYGDLNNNCDNIIFIKMTDTKNNIPRPRLTIPENNDKYFSDESDDCDCNNHIHIENGKLENGKLENGKLENGKLENGKLENGKLEDGKLENGKLENGKLVILPKVLDKIKEVINNENDNLIILSNNQVVKNNDYCYSRYVTFIHNISNTYPNVPFIIVGGVICICIIIIYDAGLFS